MWKISMMLVCMILLTSCSNVSKVCVDVPEIEVEQKSDSIWSFRGLNIGLKFNQDCRGVPSPKLETTPVMPEISEDPVIEPVVGDIEGTFEVVENNETNKTTIGGQILWGEN